MTITVTILDENVRLIPQSGTSFAGTDGLIYTFDSEGSRASFMVERHVSGDWRYTRLEDCPRR